MNTNTPRIRAMHFHAALMTGVFAFFPTASQACDDQNTCFGAQALPQDNGTANSAFGYRALLNNATGQDPWNGSFNTAVGAEALIANTVGGDNTAVGYQALYSNTSGVDNTAVGYQALFGNISGYLNVAFGYQTLFANSDGRLNAAFGYQALSDNVSGERNSGLGGRALFRNTTGTANTAVGHVALSNNRTGSNNTVVGDLALVSSESGNGNTALGQGTLLLAKGSRNTTAGMFALGNLYSGSRNVAIGANAGQAMTSGGDNILIGTDNVGVAAEVGVIRIGTVSLQRKAFVAGIRGVKTAVSNAVPVLIDSNGQLGTIKSTRVAKENIRPMGDVSARLMTLRPVTFQYREADENGSKPVQFGLIAEEVAESFPELVVHDADGRPETVSYHLLATLLVNEFQKQVHEIDAQAARIRELERNVESLIRSQAAMIEVMSGNGSPARVAATTN